MVITFFACWPAVIVILKKKINSRFSVDSAMTFAQSCLNINQKYCYLLTEFHFIMSRINPSSSLSVILNMRWSSSRMTSRGTMKNGSARHPGCFDHKLLSFLAMASLWKYSHECDILHL